MKVELTWTGVDVKSKVVEINGSPLEEEILNAKREFWNEIIKGTNMEEIINTFYRSLFIMARRRNNVGFSKYFVQKFGDFITDYIDHMIIISRFIED